MARKKTAAQLQHEINAATRLSIAVFPTGFSYADRGREKHGDYVKLARLPFGTLELEWTGESMPPAMRARILDHARKIQGRRGESYVVSQAGQTVTLGK